MSNLKREVFFTLAGTLSISGLYWVVASLLSINYGSNVFANFSIAQGLVVPFFILSSFSLKNIFLNHSSDKFFVSDSGFYFFRFFTTFISLLTVIGIGWFFYGLGDILYFIAFLGLMKSIEHFAEFRNLRLYRDGLNTPFSISCILRGIGGVLVFLVLTEANVSFYLGLACIVVYSYLVYLFTDKNNFVVKLNRRFKESLYVFKLGFPLTFSVFLISCSQFMPRFFIENSQGIDVLAVYSAVISIILIGAIPINSICVAIRPRLLHLFRTKQRNELNLLILKSSLAPLGVSLLMIFISSIFPKEIISIMYGSLFGAERIFFVFSVSSVLFYLGTFFCSVIASLGFFKETFIASLVYFFLTFIVCFFLLVQECQVQWYSLSLSVPAIVFFVSFGIVFRKDI
jgi:O-antigen/teichoic acid export membrane protein